MHSRGEVMKGNQQPFQVTTEEMSTSPQRLVRSCLLTSFYLLAGMLGALAFAVIGVIMGGYYGGNYATNYEFNGVRGYEAMGQVGALIGMVIGGPLSGFLFHLVVKQLRRNGVG